MLESALNAFRIAVQSALRDLNRCPILDGNLVEDVSLSSGSNSINHKLGRNPVGYLVVKSENGVDDLYMTSSNRSNITVYSSNACVVSIWVF